MGGNGVLRLKRRRVIRRTVKWAEQTRKTRLACEIQGVGRGSLHSALADVGEPSRLKERSRA